MRVVLGLLLTFTSGLASRAADLNDPVWAFAPDRAAWVAAYPASAIAADVSGEVEVRCVAKVTGELRDCAVAQETPTGYGFATAALSLASQMSVAAESCSVTGRYVPKCLG
jgi:hypothetical protein